MQRLTHLLSLNLQISLNYLYCLIPFKMWSQHFPLLIVLPLMLWAPHNCSSTLRQSAIREAFSARQKQLETELALELCKSDKYLLATCRCTLANGKLCCTLFSNKYLINTKAQSFLLSWEQLDMLLLGSVASTVCDEKDVRQQIKWSQVCKMTENNNRLRGQRLPYVQEHFYILAWG